MCDKRTLKQILFQCEGGRGGGGMEWSCEASYAG